MRRRSKMSRRESPEETWERMRNASAARGAMRESAAPVAHSSTQTTEDPPSSSRPEPRTETAERAYRRTETAPRDDVGGAAADSPVGDLVKQLAEQTKTLVSQELRLAQTELQQKGKKVGIGAGLFGAGGLVGFFAAAVLITALVVALSTALAAWLAALIVGVALLAIAGAAALLGKKQVEQAIPPAPEQAIGSVKRDVETVKRRARPGNR